MITYSFLYPINHKAKKHIFSVIKKKITKPHETQETLRKKYMLCSVLVNIDPQIKVINNFCYLFENLRHFFILFFKIHFRKFQSDKKNCKKKWF